MKPDKYYFEKLFSQRKKIVFRYDRGTLRDILKQKSSGKVLDLGCGIGGLALDLAQKGFDVTCVDISKTAIKKIKEETLKRKVEINAICADLEDYKIEENYDIILILGVLQFLGDKGEKYIEKIQRHTKKGGINIIDAFRNKWLPKGRLEKIYSEWNILEKEEYIWEKDNFAKMIYLVTEKRFGGWQCWVDVEKDYVIKTIKNRKEITQTVRRYTRSEGKTNELKKIVDKMQEDIVNSTRIIKSSKIPRKLLADPKFLEDGRIKQKKAIILENKFDELLRKGKKNEIKELIDKIIDFVVELWKYKIHEKTLKFYSNFGLINNKIVLIDLFELTDQKEKVERQIKNREKYLKKINKQFSPEFAKYFLDQAEKKFTTKKLNEVWGIKVK